MMGLRGRSFGCLGGEGVALGGGRRSGSEGVNVLVGVRRWSFMMGCVWETYLVVGCGMVLGGEGEGCGKLGREVRYSRDDERRQA